VTLTWISNNANSCVASGGWSRTRAISGSESTGRLTSSKTYTITCSGLGGSATDSVIVNISTPYSPPTVDIKTNNSDGPITIAYNTSASLTWTSTNANSCYASNAWSGAKATSGSQLTGNLTSLKTYTITCTGSGGSASDSVTVNTPTDAKFSTRKTVRNLSRGTVFSDSIYADPGEVLTFGIAIKAGNNPIYNVVVKDTLPTGIIYRGDLRVDNILTIGDIFTGLNIGNLAAGQNKTITFRGDVAGAESFSFGQTELINTVSVSSGTISHSDTAKIIVTRTAVAGAVTLIPTGLTNNLFLDSFLLPLVIASLTVWLFKSRIIQFEEWLDERKRKYQKYKSQKILQLKIAQIKAREFLIGK